MTQWKAVLSDGSIFTEGQTPFEYVPGKPSPYLRLIEYLKLKNLKIASLSIISGTQTFNLPSPSNYPKFSLFIKNIRPAELAFFRMFGINSGSDNQDIYAVAQATYENGQKLQLWVGEEPPGECWVLAVPPDQVTDGGES